MSDPILFTNRTRNVMTPPRLAPSGFSAQDIVDAVPDWPRLHEPPTHRPCRPARVPDEAVEIVSAFFDEVLTAGR